MRALKTAMTTPDKYRFLSFDKTDDDRTVAVDIWKIRNSEPFFFNTSMTIDADGAPNAYHPDNRHGLDFLGNAGHPGDWWALATDNGRVSGRPLVQRDGDPFPGYYISQTSLRDKTKPDRDTTKYVDARSVPYIALPPALLSETGAHGLARMGDLAMVINAKVGTSSFAIVADQGPPHGLGEGSIALGNALRIPTNLRARRAGTSGDVIYVVFPNTAAEPLWPRPLDNIKAAAERAFSDWGGMTLIRQCYPQYHF